MLRLGIALVCVGIIVAAVGFGLPGNMPDGNILERVGNIAGVHNRQFLKLMLVITGNGLLLSGVVLAAASELADKLRQAAAPAAAPRRKAAA